MIRTLLLSILVASSAYRFALADEQPPPPSADETTASVEEQLLTAVNAGDLTSVEQLLAAGANVDAATPSGMTAYQVARMRGFRELAAVLADHAADTQARFPPPEQVLDAFLNEHIEGRVPAIAVLVSHNAEVLFSNAYGLACLAHDVPATPQSRFRIGSVTKQFTAAAILKLQEEGKLSVDDPLSKFLPEFPCGDEVTLRHLLTHTSGIHSYTDKPEFMEKVGTDIEPTRLIDWFRDDPFDFSPGEQWKYCNSGYFLLGRVIEIVSGESYAAYLQSTFFDPLGMTATGVHTATAVIPHEAFGYTFADGEIRKAVNWNMAWAGAAGALYSTIEDLNIWNDALFAGKVLSAESSAAAWTSHVLLATGKPTGYGYGWSLSKLRGLSKVEHGGGLHGFVSQLTRLPDQNMTIVVLMNATPHPAGLSPGEVASRIAELFLWREMEDRKVSTELADYDPARFEVFVGRYDYGNAILTVTTEKDRLYAQLSGQPRFEIYPKADSKFFWKVVEAEVEFVCDENGQVTKAIHYQGGQIIEAARLTERKQIELAENVLQRYVGKYDYGGPVLTVTREGQQLYAQLTDQPRFEIFPQAEDSFFWKVVEAEVRFVVNEEGEVVKAIHTQGGQTINAPAIK